MGDHLQKCIKTLFRAVDPCLKLNASKSMSHRVTVKWVTLTNELKCDKVRCRVGVTAGKCAWLKVSTIETKVYLMSRGSPLSTDEFEVMALRIYNRRTRPSFLHRKFIKLRGQDTSLQHQKSQKKSHPLYQEINLKLKPRVILTQSVKRIS